MLWSRGSLARPNVCSLQDSRCPLLFALRLPLVPCSPSPPSPSTWCTSCPSWPASHGDASKKKGPAKQKKRGLTCTLSPSGLAPQNPRSPHEHAPQYPHVSSEQIPPIPKAVKHDVMSSILRSDTCELWCLRASHAPPRHRSHPPPAYSLRYFQVWVWDFIHYRTPPDPPCLLLRYFKPGPWTLGIWAYPIGIVGTLWTAFMLITFSLPTSYPVEGETLNFAGIMLLGVILLNLAVFFFPVYGAHAWFKGPDTYSKDLVAAAAAGRSHEPGADVAAAEDKVQVVLARGDSEMHVRRSYVASRDSDRI